MFFHMVDKSWFLQSCSRHIPLDDDNEHSTFTKMSFYHSTSASPFFPLKHHHPFSFDATTIPPHTPYHHHHLKQQEGREEAWIIPGVTGAKISRPFPLWSHSACPVCTRSCFLVPCLPCPAFPCSVFPPYRP